MSKSSNGFIVLGTSASAGIEGDWIFEIDNDGNMLWQKSYNWGGTQLESIRQVPAGGYIICGSKSNESLLFKISDNGDSLWHRTFGGDFRDDRLGDVIPTADGGFLAAGNRNFQPLGINTATGEYVDIWVIKTDAEGTLQYEKQFGGNNLELFFDLIETKDGGFLITGMTASTNLPNYHGYWDLYALKLDANADLMWQKSIGGTMNDGAKSTVELADGSFMFAASTGSTDGDITDGSESFWQLTLSPGGELISQKSVVGPGFWINAAVGSEDGKLTVAGGAVNGTHGGSDAWLFTSTNE